MKKYLFFLTLSCFTFIFATMPSDRPVIVSTDTINVDNKIFQTYSLPYDLPKDATPQEMALFAWEEMIALNWQSSYAKDKKRDHPDNSWNYANPTIPETVVWETYAHRQELRPANADAADYDLIKNDFDSTPSYTFGQAGAPFNITYPKGVDGHLFNCLDEDNEIGSCVLFETTGKTVNDLNSLVIYQAKINREGFEYRKRFYNGKDKLKVAAARSRVATRSKVDKTLALVKNNKDKIAQCETPDLANSTDANSITKQGNGAICLPCSYDGTVSQQVNKLSSNTGPIGKSRGVIEIKTAWRKLKPGENAADFFHRKVLYFPEVDEVKKTATAANDEYVLIGMHINHKTANYPTFTIATFEHMSVEGNYQYVSKPSGDNDYGELYKINSALRQHSYLEVYDPVTKQVHQALKKVSPSHYLLNYRLAGVQGNYDYGYASLKERNEPSFFLSNYVIESDYHLSDFYGSFAQPQIGVQDNFFNLINHHQEPITTGGCMGCHGVAQTLGFDMSFVLDNNRPAPNPDAGRISKSELIDTYLTAKAVLENGSPVFLSYLDQGQITGYVDKSVGANNSMTTVSYNGQFANAMHTFDFDGEPRDNIVFKTVAGQANVFNMEYIPPGAGAVGGIPIYYDSAGNQFLVGRGKPAANFQVTFKESGIVNLTYLDSPTAKSGKPVSLDPTHLFPTLGSAATDFKVDGYDGKPFGKSRSEDIQAGARVFFTIDNKYVLAGHNDILYAAEYDKVPAIYKSGKQGELYKNFEVKSYDPNSGIAELEYVAPNGTGFPVGIENINTRDIGITGSGYESLIIRKLPNGYVTIQNLPYNNFPGFNSKVNSLFLMPYPSDDPGIISAITAGSQVPVGFAVNYIN